LENSDFLQKPGRDEEAESEFFEGSRMRKEIPSFFENSSKDFGKDAVWLEAFLIFCRWQSDESKSAFIRKNFFQMDI
jgi:hypothetical protein